MLAANLFPKGPLQPDLPPDIAPRAAHKDKSWFKNREERQRIEAAEALIAEAKRQLEAEREAYGHHLKLKVSLQRREMRVREQEEREHEEQAQQRLLKLLEARRRQRKEVARGYYHPGVPPGDPKKPPTAEATRANGELIWWDDDSDAVATPVVRKAPLATPIEPGTVAWLHQNLLGDVLKLPQRRGSMPSPLHTPTSNGTPTFSSGLRSFTADGHHTPQRPPKAMVHLPPKAPIATLSQWLNANERSDNLKDTEDAPPVTPPTKDTEPSTLVEDRKPQGDATFLTSLETMVSSHPEMAPRHAVQRVGRHGKVAALPDTHRPLPRTSPKLKSDTVGRDQELQEERLAEFQEMQWYAAKVVQYAEKAKKWLDPDLRR